jgi:hypothetical protein
VEFFQALLCIGGEFFRGVGGVDFYVGAEVKAGVWQVAGCLCQQEKH